VKLLYILTPFLLTSCITLNNKPLTPATTTTQPPDSGRQFERNKDKVIYELFNFESNFTESPEDCAAFAASCFVLNPNKHLVGSGALIRSDVVLTAAHVASSVTDGYVQFSKDDGYFKVKEVWLSPAWLVSGGVSGDLALLLLETPVEGIAPMELASNINYLPRYASNLYTVGCSLGYKKQSLPDVFFYYGTLTVSPYCLQLRSNRTIIWHGDSGGAVFYDDCRGGTYLVGVVASYSKFQGVIVDFTAVDVRAYYMQIKDKLGEWKG
jgi:hypothetical protein